MEELLPLLIAIGASIALSLLKKKPGQPTESDQLPQNSPWDDLWEEIERARRSTEESQTPSTPTSTESVAGESTIATTSSSSSADSPHTSIPSQASLPQKISPISQQRGSVVPSSEQDVVPSVIPSTMSVTPENSSVNGIGDAVFSYDDEAIQAAMRRVEQMQSSSISLPFELDSTSADSTDDERQETVVGIDESLFPGGFDLRTGVIYSEILKPKFKD
jgi:hypothetical protein